MKKSESKIRRDKVDENRYQNNRSYEDYWSSDS